MKTTENLREMIGTNDFFQIFYLFNAYTNNSLSKVFGVSPSTIKAIKKEYEICGNMRMPPNGILEDFQEIFDPSILLDLDQILNNNFINKNVEDRIKLKAENHGEKIVQKTNSVGIRHVRRQKDSYVYAAVEPFVNKDGKKQQYIYSKNLSSLKDKVIENNLIWEEI